MLWLLSHAYDKNTFLGGGPLHVACLSSKLRPSPTRARVSPYGRYAESYAQLLHRAPILFRFVRKFLAAPWSRKKCYARADHRSPARTCPTHEEKDIFVLLARMLPALLVLLPAAQSVPSSTTDPWRTFSSCNILSNLAEEICALLCAITARFPSFPKETVAQRSKLVLSPTLRGRVAFPR